jgi:hypothetical protein
MILYDKHLQPDGSREQLILKSPRLKDAAVPSVFPNLASYLSKPAIKERTDPEFRRETISKRQNDEVENFMKADIIYNFNDLITTFSIELNLIGWEHKIVEFGIYFFTLNFNDSLNIETKMYINESLQVKDFYKRRRINSTSYLVTYYEEFFLLWIRPTGETTVKKRILHSTSTVMRKSMYYSTTPLL